MTELELLQTIAQKLEDIAVLQVDILTQINAILSIVYIMVVCGGVVLASVLMYKVLKIFM